MMIVCLLFCVIRECLFQKAFILSSSIGFYNYRQTANVMKVYSVLLERGFTAQDILLGIPQNTGCCQKNPLYGTISFYDNDYTNLNKNVQIDLKHMHLQQTFDSMRDKYPVRTLNKRKLNLEFQPYFIYLTGHGGDYYFKLREREAFVDEHFLRLFFDINLRKRASKIVLMSDSCSAITPFEHIHQDNFCALGSSSFNEKSTSHGYDSTLNIAKSDDFTFYFVEWLKTFDLSIRKLHSFLTYDKLKVHAKLIQNKFTKNMNLKKFLNKDIIVVKKKVILF